MQLRCRAGKGEQRIQLQAIARVARERLHFLFEILDFARRDQSQMAAFHRTRRIGRHRAEHRQTGVLLDNACIVIGHARRNAVQNHAADGILFKLQKAAQQCRQRQRHALGGDDEHSRGLREPRDVRRRIFAARAGKPVIVAHDAFYHGNIAPRAMLQQGRNLFPPAQKRVQIARARADNPAVEHRVDVIRSAFECRRIQSPFHKCLQ